MQKGQKNPITKPEQQVSFYTISPLFRKYKVFNGHFLLLLLKVIFFLLSEFTGAKSVATGC